MTSAETTAARNQQLDRCPACQATKPFSLRWPEHEIHVCGRCGLGMSTMSPSDDLYETEYFEGGEYRSYRNEEAALRSNFREVLKYLLRHAPGGRLLEIGSAYGFFLEEAARHYTASGVELSGHACETARQRTGVQIRQGDFLDLPAPADPWDVVCLWDTIEHLVDPRATLEKAVKELTPGGVLALTTGDFSSVLARLRGRHWRQIHPPSHLYYFTRAAIRALLTSCGLRVTEERSLGFTRRYANIVRGLIGRRGSTGQALERALTINGTIDFSIRVNTFDYVLAIGRKAK